MITPSITAFGTLSLVSIDAGFIFLTNDGELGAYAGGYYEVLAGLSVGDTVVTSGQFLIDSDANLKSAGTSMAGMSMPPDSSQSSRKQNDSMQNMPGMNMPTQENTSGGNTDSMEDMPGMDMHGEGMDHHAPNLEPRTKNGSTQNMHMPKMNHPAPLKKSSGKNDDMNSMPGMNMSHDSTGQEH